MTAAGHARMRRGAELILAGADVDAERPGAQAAQIADLEERIHASGLHCADLMLKLMIAESRVNVLRARLKALAAIAATED
jgi:hypothetical protein